MPPMRSRSARPLVLLCLFALVLALLAAGCGGDDGGGGAADDPASIVPAAAPVYVQGTLKPEGEAKAAIEELAATVGFSNPGQRIIDLIDQGLAQEDSGLTYEADIEPWLGENAGIFVNSFTDESEAAGIVQTTDADAAQDFLDAAKQTIEGARDATYKDVEYTIDPDDDSAMGIIDDFVVIGDEAAFKSAVDATEGDTLAGQGEFEDALDAAPDGSVADVYVDIGAFVQAVGQEVEPDTARFFRSTLEGAEGKTALVSLVPHPDRVEVQASTDAAESIATSSAAEVFSTIPVDAWAAFGIADVGGQLEQLLAQFDEAGVSGVDLDELKSQLNTQGIDLDELIASLGDAAVFVEGTDLQSLGAALVIFSEDEQATTDGIQRFEELLRRSQTPGIGSVGNGAVGFTYTNQDEIGPKPIVVVAFGDRVAIAYGKDAAAHGLPQGGDGLSGASSFKAAQAALGDTEISGFVSFGPILELASALGIANDTDFSLAAPYLEHLDYLALGTGAEGDRATAKLILGIKE
jgi:hypothetical protein